MLSPGAAMSTLTGPHEVNDARPSVLFDAATTSRFEFVNSAGTSRVPPSMLFDPLPAATQITIPAV
jgi:hypothetical protein